jgi:hypothetical protein
LTYYIFFQPSHDPKLPEISLGITNGLIHNEKIYYFTKK